MPVLTSRPGSSRSSGFSLGGAEADEDEAMGLAGAGVVLAVVDEDEKAAAGGATPYVSMPLAVVLGAGVEVAGAEGFGFGTAVVWWPLVQPCE